MTGQRKSSSSHTALQDPPVLTQPEARAIQLPEPEKDADGRPQHFLSLLGGGVCTHLLGEAVWPPRGGNELLQTCLLHTQRALDVEEHNGTEHVEAVLELKQAQKLQREKVQGMSPEL